MPKLMIPKCLIYKFDQVIITGLYQGPPITDIEKNAGFNKKPSILHLRHQGETCQRRCLQRFALRETPIMETRLELKGSYVYNSQIIKQKQTTPAKPPMMVLMGGARPCFHTSDTFREWREIKLELIPHITPD